LSRCNTIAQHGLHHGQRPITHSSGSLATPRSDHVGPAPGRASLQGGLPEPWPSLALTPRPPAHWVCAPIRWPLRITLLGLPVVRRYVAQSTGRIGLSNKNNSESHCQARRTRATAAWVLKQRIDLRKKIMAHIPNPIRWPLRITILALIGKGITIAYTHHARTPPRRRPACSHTCMHSPVAAHTGTRARREAMVPKPASEHGTGYSPFVFVSVGDSPRWSLVAGSRRPAPSQEPGASAAAPGESQAHPRRTLDASGCSPPQQHTAAASLPPPPSSPPPPPPRTAKPKAGGGGRRRRRLPPATPTWRTG
jgi:hypothetical protein